MNTTEHGNGLDLERLEAMEKAATKAPWVKKDSASGLSVYLMNEGRFLAESSWHGNSQAFPTRTGTNANFDLLAALRNAAPALIAAARRLEIVEGRLAACERALVAHPVNEALAAANARIAGLEAALTAAPLPTNRG